MTMHAETTPLTPYEIGWLAGLFDGEGSIGATVYTKTGRTKPTVTLQVQMSMTCKETIEHALDLLTRLGCRGNVYYYEERDPTKHKDACHLRCNRLADANLLARTLLPYSVTKRRQWALALEFTDSRLAQTPTEPSTGRAKRGGLNRTDYTERQLEVARELATINRRGPQHG